MKHKKLSAFAFTQLLLIPSLAFADAGTPLLWLSMLHLVIGNAIIGVIEGRIVSKLFKINDLRSILLMIGANYISASAGAGCLWLLDVVHIDGLQLFFFNHLKFSIGVILTILIVLTIFIESPFIYFLNVERPRKWKTALRTSLIVQAVSYVLISPLYFLASTATISPPWIIKKIYSARKINGYVLFLDEDGRSLQKVNLKNLGRGEQIEKWGKKVFNGYIYVNLDKKPALELKISGSSDNNYRQNLNFDLKHTIPFDTLDEKWLDKFNSDIEIKNRPDSEKDQVQKHFKECFREPVDYSLGNNLWEKNWIGIWAAEGFRFSLKSNPKETLGMAVESPPFWWSAACPTILPEDQVVIQFGPFILFLDLNNHIAYPIGIGRSPIVILQKDNKI
ncbi:MAG: hypothetical protein ACXVCP_03040 [Bdellovibrio sp.]